jgi:hypothetical protein
LVDGNIQPTQSCLPRRVAHTHVIPRAVADRQLLTIRIPLPRRRAARAAAHTAVARGVAFLRRLPTVFGAPPRSASRRPSVRLASRRVAVRYLNST